MGYDIRTVSYHPGMTLNMSPRRLTGAEEMELLAAADQAKEAAAEARRLLAKRDHLIAELIDSGCRIVDIASVLDLSVKAIRDARERALDDS